MILFNWLFQDDLLFRALATNLANIIIRKDDRYIALGWCILVRNLLEYETSITQYSMNGKHIFIEFMYLEREKKKNQIEHKGINLGIML
jgi:hypothetical protein